VLDTLVQIWVSSIYGETAGQFLWLQNGVNYCNCSSFGSSMVDGVGSSLPWVMSRLVFRRIFPERVLGSVGTTSTCFKSRPAYWPGGDRRKGGARLKQASARNVGTCRPSGAGRVLDRPVEGSAPSSGIKGSSTGAGHGGDRLVSSTAQLAPPNPQQHERV
jgi:hypothetical protein